MADLILQVILSYTYLIVKINENLLTKIFKGDIMKKNRRTEVSPKGASALFGVIYIRAVLKQPYQSLQRRWNEYKNTS